MKKRYAFGILVAIGVVYFYLVPKIVKFWQKFEAISNFIKFRNGAPA